MIHDHKCALCGETYRLTVHHINMLKNDCNLGNLILLCQKCHTRPKYAFHREVFSNLPILDFTFDNGEVIRKSLYFISSLENHDMISNWEYEGLLPPRWPPREMRKEEWEEAEKNPAVRIYQELSEPKHDPSEMDEDFFYKQIEELMNLN